MTRINVGIHPQELPTKLLIAEHREITRIPNLVKHKKYATNWPPMFTLGRGHVKFFYSRLRFLRRRYIALYEECMRRGLDVENKISAFDDIPPWLNNDYTPTLHDRELVLSRMREKPYSFDERFWM